MMLLSIWVRLLLCASCIPLYIILLLSPRAMCNVSVCVFRLKLKLALLTDTLRSLSAFTVRFGLYVLPSRLYLYIFDISGVWRISGYSLYSAFDLHLKWIAIHPLFIRFCLVVPLCFEFWLLGFESTRVIGVNFTFLEFSGMYIPN